MSNHLFSVYNTLPIEFTHGEGIWLFDQNNNKYFDALSGLGVTILGHTHPTIIAALQEQAQKVWHVSNRFTIPQKETLAKKLCSLTNMEKAFFCNSGAEAVETAIKLSRLYGQARQIKQPTLIVLEGAFHGRTLATLTASSARHVQAGYDPLVPGFVRAPFNDIQAIQNISKTRNDITGILLEPIQGSGGIQVAQKDYLQKLRQLCDTNNWLLICDEIQSGMGRTGKFLNIQHANIQPDIVTLAKGLGNGFPIGACLGNQKVANLFKPGNHGTTFGGNPLACHIATKTLETLETENLIENAATIGQQIYLTLKEQFAKNPHILSLRGKGLMIGIELDKPCPQIPQIALEEGILLNITNKNTIRLLPPLITNQKQALYLCEKLNKIINRFYE